MIDKFSELLLFGFVIHNGDDDARRTSSLLFYRDNDV